MHTNKKGIRVRKTGSLNGGSPQPQFMTVIAFNTGIGVHLVSSVVSIESFRLR